MKREKFSGWQQLVLVSLATGFGFNLLYSAMSITNAAMYSNGQITMSASMYGLAFSVGTLVQGPPMMLIAKLVRKLGTRKTLMLGYGSMAAVALLLSNFITSGVSFIIIYGLLYSICNAATSQLAPQTLVNNWFFEQRGKAQSIKLAIGCLITVISPVAVTPLIYNVGGSSFRFGWYVCGISACIAFFFSLFLKNTP